MSETKSSEHRDRASALRNLVRQGYDQISEAYRSDDGEANQSSAEDTSRYRGWIDELASELQPGSRVLDLGCGNGLPAARLLVERQFQVIGVDFSSSQVQRARNLVPRATFIHADLVTWEGADHPFDAAICLYAFIHIPEENQQPLLSRTHSWLRDGAPFLCIIGSMDWTGQEEYFGSPMFWDHRDSDTTIGWMKKAGFRIEWQRFVPEGDVGHVLVLARKEPSIDMGRSWRQSL